MGHGIPWWFGDQKKKLQNNSVSWGDGLSPSQAEAPTAFAQDILVEVGQRPG